MGANGAWDTLWGFAPIVLLIVLTFRGWPTSSSLPLSTVALWLVALVWFKMDPGLVNASVIKGLGDSLTTIAIVFGAICLFESLKMTGALDWMTGKLRSFSRGNKTAEIMLIAWAFGYLVEGASGFGTPTALAAPLLVEIGYEAKPTVVCCLIMNTLATPFGAAGTPLWFGFDGLVDDSTLKTVGFLTQVICATAAFVVPAIGVMQLLPASALRKQALTYFICVYACAGASLAVSVFSYELPTLLGGGAGLLLSASYVKATNTPDVDDVVESVRSMTSSRRSRQPLRVVSEKKTSGGVTSSHDDQLDDDDGSTLSKKELPQDVDKTAVVNAASFGDTGSGDDDYEDVELAQTTSDGKDMVMGFGTATTGDDDDDDNASQQHKSSSHFRNRKTEPTWKYVFPLGMVVFYLTLTRFPIIDLKDELKSQHPRLEFRLGSLGEFWVSSALVVGLSNIFREPVSTTFEVLYVPGILPFIAVSIMTMCIFGRIRDVPLLFRTTWARTHAVLIPVMAALVLAALMRAGVAQRLATPIITSFGKIGWLFVAPLFGVLGSFFSGSTTVSNLTFGGVQVHASHRLGLNKVHLLAMQTAGATIGNCVCLQNIISAKAVVGLDVPEADFIKSTWKPALVFIVITWAWGFIFLA